MLAVQFGDLIRKERLAKGLKQAELASAAGVSRTILSRLEQGKPRPVQTDVLDRILQALGVNLSRFIRVPLKNGLAVLFLDPNDAAVSKYARGEPRDRAWLQAGLAAGLLSAPIIESRLRDTTFFDDEEHQRACGAFAEDKAG